MINVNGLSTLQKALLMANRRVAMLKGATKTWCVGADFVCDIPGYTGYRKGITELQRAADDLGVNYTFPDTPDCAVKIYASISLANGACLAMTVPLPDTDGFALPVITVLHLYWLSEQTKVKGTYNLVEELSRNFDVSFGAELRAHVE